MKGKLILVLIGLVALGVWLRSRSPLATDSPQPDECASSANGYLHSLMTGDSLSAAGFWKPGVEPKRLFAVHNFHQVINGPFLKSSGEPFNIPRVHYEYEIESSTKGGIPIRKRWNILMEPSTKDYGGLDCAIVDVVDAE
jgi:hypothetical protein